MCRVIPCKVSSFSPSVGEGEGGKEREGERGEK